MRLRATIIPIALATMPGCFASKREVPAPTPTNESPEDSNLPERGHLDARLLLPQGVSLGRLFPSYAQEWLEPCLPDPGDSEVPPNGMKVKHCGSAGRAKMVDDGSFRIWPEGDGPVMLWLDFRPSEWDCETGWEGLWECNLAVYLGKVDVPRSGVVRREFDLCDLYPGSVAVDVRVNGTPAPQMRVTIMCPDNLSDPHQLWMQAIREGRQYSGGTTAKTDADGHATVPRMFAGQWACYVRPSDRSWIYIAKDPVVVRAGFATRVEVDAALSLHELHFVRRDMSSVSPNAPNADTAPLAGTKVRWFQRTQLGPLGAGHAMTDHDGCLTLQLPSGPVDFEIDDGVPDDQHNDEALVYGHKFSRVIWSEQAATPQQVCLRTP